MLTRQLLRRALPLALAGATGLCAAAGQVDVRFVEPARFSDAGFGEREIGVTTAALGRHLQALSRRLADGQTLQLEVLDIDLAGRSNIPTGRQDVRVLTGGADVPRIRLRYTLQSAGRTLQAGEEDLVDLNYLWPTGTLADNGAYAHERRLLDRWFNQRFTAP